MLLGNKCHSSRALTFSIPTILVVTTIYYCEPDTAQLTPAKVNVNVKRSEKDIKPGTLQSIERQSGLRFK
jgi:hypothetical protein